MPASLTTTCLASAFIFVLIGSPVSAVVLVGLALTFEVALFFFSGLNNDGLG